MPDVRGGTHFSEKLDHTFCWRPTEVRNSYDPVSRQKPQRPNVTATETNDDRWPARSQLQITAETQNNKMFCLPRQEKWLPVEEPEPRMHAVVDFAGSSAWVDWDSFSSFSSWRVCLKVRPARQQSDFCVLKRKSYVRNKRSLAWRLASLECCHADLYSLRKGPAKSHQYTLQDLTSSVFQHSKTLRLRECYVETLRTEGNKCTESSSCNRHRV